MILNNVLATNSPHLPVLRRLGGVLLCAIYRPYTKLAKAIFIGRIQEYLLNKSRDVEFAAEFAAKEKKPG
jgi:hypothetical protein